MSAKERWGFSSQPVHVQASSEHKETYHNDSDSSPDTDESLCCCCPSLYDLLTNCSSYCGQYFCCCCCHSKQKARKFSNVSYRYLHSEKSCDSIDGGLLPDEKPVGDMAYKSVFQFPQGPQQFPTHPSLPFKPNRIDFHRPQTKYAPGGRGRGGGGGGQVVSPDTGSPFPAPYLYDRGPGLQTPFVAPIQLQPRALNIGGLPLTTATTQRKKRTSRIKNKPSFDDELGSTVSTPEITGEKVPIAKDEEEEMLQLGKSQGRHMSLPSDPPLERGRKRLFSMSCRRVPVVDEDDEMTTESEKNLRKKRIIHRARTVGGTPSRQPSVDPEKYRRCQTPELSSNTSPEGRKGLALRKCRTPDVVLMGKSRTNSAKRLSDSPETEGSSTITSPPSPGEKLGGPTDEGDTELAAERGGGGGGGEVAATAKKESLVTKIISTDGHRRRWGSRRDKSRRKESAPGTEGGTTTREKSSRTHTLPPHISQSPSSYRTSGGSIETDGTREGGASVVLDPPVVYFSLYFDIQRRALTVNLIKVVNLPRKPANQGSCDPFVMMFLLPNKQEVLQSVVKHRTLNPEFQQVFEFGGILANDLKNQVLVFRVFDHDRFSKNDLIGTVIMPLKDADLYGMLMRREVDQRKGLLKQFSAGDLLFSLSYSQERQVLNGIILKATNLRKADIWGLADPYVKVYMFHKNRRINKWKTEVKKNTLVPIYNESFQFDMCGMDMRNVRLELWVMDYDWFSRNDKMGVVYVGVNSLQEVGRSHWLEILSSPEHQTSHWHTIIPYTDLKQVLPLAKQQQPQQQQQQQKQPNMGYLEPPSAEQHRQQLGNNGMAQDNSNPHNFRPDS